MAFQHIYQGKATVEEEFQQALVKNNIQYAQDIIDHFQPHFGMTLAEAIAFASPNISLVQLVINNEPRFSKIRDPKDAWHLVFQSADTAILDILVKYLEQHKIFSQVFTQDTIEANVSVLHLASQQEREWWLHKFGPQHFHDQWIEELVTDEVKEWCEHHNIKLFMIA